MLDDAKFVATYDQGNALGIVGGQPDQLTQTFRAPDLKLPKTVVLTGMGGSALAGELIHSWLSDVLKVPFEVVRGYNLPAYVNSDTLVIVSSYSGNTEEALACLEQAESRHSQIVILAASGKLSEIASSKNYPLLSPPAGLQPRFAVFYDVKAIAVILESSGLAHGIVDELDQAHKWLIGHVSNWAATVPEADNQAKQIAEAIFGFPVIIYGGPTLAMAAHKWKIDFNENAKQVAWWNELPEMNHNEFIGWQHPRERRFKVVELQSNLDNERVSKRFELTNQLLSGQMPAPIMVRAQGKTKIEQLLWAIMLGDFAATYTAFLYQVDPTPVELVEKLKEKLG